jgi:transposase
MVAILLTTTIYLLTAPMSVTMVRTVVTPSPTLAGAEALSNQKETQDMQTIILEGMYTCKKEHITRSMSQTVIVHICL